MKNFYDVIVIGAGISGCTFASSFNKRFPDSSILLVEQGRRLGGRSTTRKSRKNIIFEFDHGLPAISFNKNISKDLRQLISPLINSKQLIEITNDILLINGLGDIDELLTNEKIYRCLPFMINFCEEIINQSIKPKKINFLFQTLITSIARKNNLWDVKTNDARSIQSKNLVLSSSLLAHPRCLEILDINYLPLRDAFKIGEDKIVDSLLIKIMRQEYLKRRNYILHVSNSLIVNNFNYKYLQIWFSKVLRDDFNFERIVFQRQSDGSMINVLHCFYINKTFDICIEKIIKKLILIFYKYKKIIALLVEAKLIDKMDWGASQPFNHLIPKELQWSSISNIGFCGDWFDFIGCGRVEAAMNSSIRLSKLFR